MALEDIKHETDEKIVNILIDVVQSGKMVTDDSIELTSEQLTNYGVRLFNTAIRAASEYMVDGWDVNSPTYIVARGFSEKILDLLNKQEKPIEISPR